MFEITPDDISLLNDKDLRTLVGLLCEAEVRSSGYSTSSGTWGGHQNAADGGVDVRVDLPENTVIKGFLPRAACGFQGESRGHGTWKNSQGNAPFWSSQASYSGTRG
jgi:hypothetical protein